MLSLDGVIIESGDYIIEYMLVFREFYKSRRENPHWTIVADHNMILRDILAAKTVCTSCEETFDRKDTNDSICLPCLQEKEEKKAAKILRKLDIGFGNTLYGKDIDRHLNHERRKKKNEKDIKNGVKARCKNCKRVFSVSYMSVREGVCKKCLSLIIEASQATNRREEEEKIKILATKKRNMLPSEKAEEASSDKDMIAQFLKNV